MEHNVVHILMDNGECGAEILGVFSKVEDAQDRLATLFPEKNFRWVEQPHNMSIMIPPASERGSIFTIETFKVH